MSRNKPPRTTPGTAGISRRSNKRDSDKHLKEQFLEALLTEPTLKKGAERVGISYATAKRWCKRADVQQAFAASRAEGIRHSSARLPHAFGLAVDTLRTTINDPNVSLSARVAAARTVIKAGRHERVLEDQEAELEALRASIRSIYVLLEQRGISLDGMEQRGVVRTRGS